MPRTHRGRAWRTRRRARCWRPACRARDPACRPPPPRPRTGTGPRGSRPPLPVEGERAAEEAGRLVELTRRHEPADVARRDGLPLDFDERHHARLELGTRLQELGVARRLLAEAEVLADGHALGAEAVDQHL